MKNREIILNWLKRARSNLERAKLGKVSQGILYEDLCFDAQQAVEKSLKAILIKLSKSFPKTHSIGILLKLIEEAGVEIPENINQAKLLTVYAVDARYPGDYEPVSKEEYNEALKIAEDIFKWLDNIIKFEE
ncbi:MAG: HEPN domain-containing protein [Candidatus Atribacteria bacterium]|nr:HEPN domain-containing protein [Candidatus Atribacteria bacterium]